MSDLAARYGTPNRSRRAVIAVAVGLCALGLGWLTWATALNITPDVSSALIGFTTNSNQQMTVKVQVSRTETTTPATCLLQALAEDHSVVGEVTVPVVSGPKKQTLQVTIRTVARGVAVNLIGCTTPSQSRPR